MSQKVASIKDATVFLAVAMHRLCSCDEYCTICRKSCAFVFFMEHVVQHCAVTEQT